MSIDVVTTGYASWDLILRVTNFPPRGQTAVVHDPYTTTDATIGGCPANIAVGCMRLGLRAATIVYIGDDLEGQHYQDALEREGVDTRAVYVVPGQRTAHSFLFVDSENEHQTYFYPGAGDGEELVLDLDPELTQQARWFVISVGNPNHNRELAESFHKRGVPIFWSLKSDPRAYTSELLKRLTETSAVIAMNEQEARVFQSTLQLSSLRALLTHDNLRGIIVTYGANGSLIIEREHEYTIPAVTPKTLIDPTGAGDAFCSGCLYGLCQNLPLEICGYIGSVVASYALEARGCQTNLPNLAQVRERYREAFGEELEIEG